jgi:putative transposase
VDGTAADISRISTSDIATQHVTFHLADSLPKDALESLEAGLKTVPAAKQDLERRKRIEAWIDAGHGSCILREAAIAGMVEGALQFFDAQRYTLVAWVVMPNHVHVLFQPLNNWSVAKIVASWKKFTARKISDYLRNPRTANLRIGGSQNIANREIGDPGGANWEIGDPGGANREIGDPGPTWHREYWDRYIRDECHFLQAIDYIHQNPVKAGLVEHAADWPWSSLRFVGDLDRQAGNPDIQDA